MVNARSILKSKGSQIWSIGPDAKVFKALEFMAEKNIGAVLVMEGDRLVGVLSERDYARKVILKGHASKDLAVRDIMTADVACVAPETTPEEAMALMVDKHIRHLPVIEGDRVIGVISIGDVVKAIISDREFTIDQLARYIRGGK